MNEWKSRVPAWAWAFLALLGLAVAFFIISLLTSNTPDELPAASASAEQTTGNTPSPSPSTTASDPNESICGLPSGDQSIPEEAPETTWEHINGFAVPVSEEFGPGIRTDTELKCFAHNPTGALFAAARWIPMTSGSYETASAFIEDNQQISFSVESQRAEHLAKLKRSFENGGPTKLQVEGFKIEMIDEDNVVVTLALGGPLETNSGYGRISMPIPLKWENGDWVIQVSTTMSGPEWIDSLVSENFIPWSGVN